MTHLQHYLFVSQRKAEIAIASAERGIRGARTLRELVLKMRPNLPPEMRALKHMLSGYSGLDRMAQERANTLIQPQMEHLRGLAKSGDVEALKKARYRYETQEWVHLRGNLPMVARRVHHEAQELLAVCKKIAQDEDKKDNDGTEDAGSGQSRPPRPLSN